MPIQAYGPGGVNVLTVNAGSSSLRLALFGERQGAPSLRGSAHLSGAREPAGILAAFAAEHGAASVDAVAHRVVHGGARRMAPCLVDSEVEGDIERAASLAPLHNPIALQGIAAARAAFGGQTPQVAVFDTAFYARLPAVAATYALPRALRERHAIRRYGFHGIAHQAMARRWRALHPDAPAEAALISLQLGAGCSITAVRGGVPVDTSMGFSPLEGLVMATRAGDLDPGLLLYLQREEGLDPQRLESLLNHESGLRGLSGATGDMRELLASGDADARLAVEVFCHRARKYVGAYLAALGGADAILFGGGIGENAPAVRKMILAGLERLGIALDEDANRAAVGTETPVGARGSEVQTWVIPVDEARALAEEAFALLRGGRP